MGGSRLEIRIVPRCTPKLAACEIDSAQSQHQPNFGRLRPNFGRGESRIRPKLCRYRPPNSVDACQIWPMLVGLGSSLADSGLRWAQVGRIWAASMAGLCSKADKAMWRAPLAIVQGCTSKSFKPRLRGRRLPQQHQQGQARSFGRDIAAKLRNRRQPGVRLQAPTLTNWERFEQHNIFTQPAALASGTIFRNNHVLLGVSPQSTFRLILGLTKTTKARPTF